MTKTVTKHTRASAAGKVVYCPHCNAELRLFHFSFSALGCRGCDKMVDKYDLLLEPKKSDYTYFLNRLTLS